MHDRCRSRKGFGLEERHGINDTMSAASLAFEQLTEADRKGLPAYPVPAVRIGRLAPSLSVRGQGLGELLLQNAIKRVLQARNTLGVHAVLVGASRQLYLPLGAE